MAITTQAGLISGLRPPTHTFKSSQTGAAGGFWITNFYRPTVPEAATAPSPGLSGAALTSYVGQIAFDNPASGNAYLAAIDGGTLTSSGGSVMFADRLWHNSGIDVTATGAQTISSVTWPARDRLGTTNGDGVVVALEVSSTMANPIITNTTLSYTNSAGASGRTGTITSVPANLGVGSTINFELQSGDSGVRSIQSLTLGTSYVSGVFRLVAYRPITLFGFSAPIRPTWSLDAMDIGFPRLFDNTVLYCLALGGTQSTDLIQTLVFAHG